MVSKRQALFAHLLSVTAAGAWVLANGLDMLSVLLALQLGGTLTFARYNPAAAFLIYAGMRTLLTLAVYLAAALVGKRWPMAANAAWSGLTACALAAALVAWWRLYS